VWHETWKNEGVQSGASADHESMSTYFQKYLSDFSKKKKKAEFFRVYLLNPICFALLWQPTSDLPTDLQIRFQRVFSSTIIAAFNFSS
jgi:hypothetical protein